MLFKGAGTAIITPFINGEVNYEKYGELIDWQIEKGIDAIITCGTTGEGSTLEDFEHKKVIEYCVNRVAGRVPVIAGTGSNNTLYGLQLSQYAESVGVDGLMIVTPYYNKTTQAGLINHYTYIANRWTKPIIMYNVPGRTGMSIDPDTVAVLSEHKKITGLKDATGNMSYTAEVFSEVKNKDFAVYSGNDDLVVPVLSLGGSGVISVVSNVMPKETHEMVMDYLEGRVEESRKMQLKLNAFLKTLFIETNPIPIKTCMNLMGFEVGETRMPLHEMSEKNKKLLVEEMNNIGLVRR